MAKIEDVIKQGYNLIELIKGLLNETQVTLKDANFKYIYQLAKMHGLQNMLYYAINNYQSYGYKDVNVEVLKQLTKDHLFAITRTATQDAELVLIEEALTKNQVKYSVLKGSVLKHLFPSSDMRSMTDIDIYFDNTKAKLVKKIMLSLGYRCKSYNKSYDDHYLKDPFMNVEMHRELVPSRFDFSRYYDDYLDKLIKDEKNDYKYHFKDEDFYLYHLAHSAKHFAIGGTGIRTIIDQYVLLEKKKDVYDWNYIKEELKKLGLSKYEENLTKLCYFWFSKENQEQKYKDRKLAKEYELMLNISEFVFSSGAYGTVQHSTLNNFVGEDELKNLKASKFKNMIKLLFPSYKFMKERNPILKKLPILLPFFYVSRLFSAFLFRRNISQARVQSTANVTKEQIADHKKTKEEMGIK